MQAVEEIVGWGIDKRPEDRPGVPLIQDHFRNEDTLQGQPPYSETIPLRGLAGIIKRAAYQVPDWKPRHWMMLMLGDRVESFESKLTPRNLAIAGAVAGGIAGAWLLVKKLK